jgi:hypothetical protein
MDKITLEDLREYRAIQESIRAIEAEIESLYYPIGSPSLISDGAGRSSVRPVSDPTAEAFRRIEADRARLEVKRAELETLKVRVDEWLNSLEDNHIAAILRWHFILGKSWRETCVEVYGYADPDICRKAVRKFFE